MFIARGSELAEPLPMILWDLDQTLLDTSALREARDRRDWGYCREHISSVRPYPGIEKAYHSLGVRFRTGVVTSSPQSYARQLLTRFDFQPEVLVSYGNTRRHKPAPDPLLFAATRLGVKPEHCIVIGDAIIDCLASRAAGMFFIGVTWGEAGLDQFLKNEVSHLVSAPDEISSMIDSLVKYKE